MQAMTGNANVIVPQSRYECSPEAPAGTLRLACCAEWGASPSVSEALTPRLARGRRTKIGLDNTIVSRYYFDISNIRYIDTEEVAMSRRHWREFEGQHRHFGGRGLRHGRPFDHGDLRYIILKLITEKPRHGYEIIKEIEEQLGGM